METRKEFENLNLKQMALLALYYLIEDIYGKTRLQKLMFLFQQKAIEKNVYKFKAHYYGPYSEILDNYNDEMLEYGLVETKIMNVDTHGKPIYYEIFTITKEGNNFYKKYRSDKVLRLIEDHMELIVRNYGYKNQKELLKEAYKYEKYTKNSVIKDSLLD